MFVSPNSPVTTSDTPAVIVGRAAVEIDPDSGLPVCICPNDIDGETRALVLAYARHVLNVQGKPAADFGCAPDGPDYHVLVPRL